MLKRGLSATIEEWLKAAEYLLAGGNTQRHVLRARHSHLRAEHSLHARFIGGSGDQESVAPADHH